MISISTKSLLSDPDNLYVFAIYLCYLNSIKYCLHQSTEHEPLIFITNEHLINIKVHVKFDEFTSLFF